MNETSLLRATHLVAARALRNNPMEVSLLVCDGYDPREVVRMKMEQERLSASNFSATIDSSSLSSEGKMMISCVTPAVLHMYTFTCTNPSNVFLYILEPICVCITLRCIACHSSSILLSLPPFISSLSSYPWSASRSLDDAVRILSESMDALPTVPLPLVSHLYYSALHVHVYYKSKQGKAKGGHSKQAANFKEKAEHDLNCDL